MDQSRGTVRVEVHAWMQALGQWTVSNVSLVYQLRFTIAHAGVLISPARRDVGTHGLSLHPASTASSLPTASCQLPAANCPRFPAAPSPLTPAPSTCLSLTTTCLVSLDSNHTSPPPAPLHSPLISLDHTTSACSWRLIYSCCARTETWQSGGSVDGSHGAPSTIHPPTARL